MLLIRAPAALLALALVPGAALAQESVRTADGVFEYVVNGRGDRGATRHP